MTQQDKDKLAVISKWSGKSLVLGFASAMFILMFGLNQFTLALCFAVVILVSIIHFFVYDAIRTASYLTMEEKRALLLYMWIFSPCAMFDFWRKARQRTTS